MADITRRIPGCDDCCDGEGGEGGERGRRGRRGSRGEDGPDGAIGPTGPTGLTGSAIIPFASGPPDELVHVLGGLADLGAVVGFGSSTASVPVGGPTVDLTGGIGFPTNMAFSMPRAGTLVQLSAFFSVAVQVAAFPVGGAVVIQVYRSATPSNIFTPVPGALVTLPLPAGLVTIGGTTSGTAAFSVPVDNNDRLLLVARVTVAGVDVATVLTGYVSAGLSIT